MIKIAIGIVDNHPVLHKGFASSLLQVVRHFDGWSFERRDKGEEMKLDVIIAENGGIAEMRNTVAETAVDGGYDYVFWMDSDQTFPEDCLPRLLSYCERDDREAASGLYTYKVPPYLPHIYPKLDETTQKFHVGQTFPLDKPMIVEAVGFGCLLMKTSVFKRLKKPWFSMRFEHGKMVEGEDLPFCREAKMDMVLDPQVSCGHLKVNSVGIADYLRYNQIEVVDGWVKPTKAQMEAVIQQQKDLMN